ncbi:hypothetical protein ABID13_004715 [Enterocloster citroniae]|uniref:Uncharacterized protein n=1 Tax=Enterocloster citroniae TaxID=358743 RepID=A0ABV2G440_9FIRM
MAESGSGLHWTVGCSVGNKQTDDEAGPAKQAQRNKPGKTGPAKQSQQNEDSKKQRKVGQKFLQKMKKAVDICRTIW